MTANVNATLAAIRTANLKYTIAYSNRNVYYSMIYYGYKQEMYGFERKDPFVIIPGSRFISALKDRAQLISGQGISISGPGSVDPFWGLPTTATLEEVMKAATGCITYCESRIESCV